MQSRVLITGAVKLSESLRANLEQLGLSVTFIQNEQGELAVDPANFDMVICNGLFLYHDIDQFTSLKYIQVTSAGLDRLPLEKIRARGIELRNARGVYSIPMAEWVLCGLLMLYKNMPKHISNKISHSWVKDRGSREICGQRALIVGYGSVGDHVAQRLHAVGVEVSASDVRDVESPYIANSYKIDTLSQVISNFDIVVLTLPLMDETYHIINQSILDKMQQGSVLVNIARGPVVDESALIQSLSSGHLGGAVLDVFEEEPLSATSPLWDMDNVILTPHNSFVSNRNSDRLEGLIVDNLNEYLY